MPTIQSTKEYDNMARNFAKCETPCNGTSTIYESRNLTLGLRIKFRVNLKKR